MKVLNIKEYILEVQEILLKKLAAEKNRLKRLIKDLGLLIINFDKRI